MVSLHFMREFMGEKLFLPIWQYQWLVKHILNEEWSQLNCKLLVTLVENLPLNWLLRILNRCIRPTNFEI